MTPYFVSAPKHARVRQGKSISPAGREDVLASELAACRSPAEVIGELVHCVSNYSELYFVLAKCAVLLYCAPSHTNRGLWN